MKMKMKIEFRFFLILLLGILIPLYAHAKPQDKLIGTIYKKTIDATPRAYIVYTPKGYDPDASTKYPVVFILHGDKCAPEIIAEAMSRFDKKADLAKFILVAPQAMYNGDAVKLGPLPARGLYDPAEASNLGISWCLYDKSIVDGELSFLKKLHGIVFSEFKVDPNRFYMTGHSRGALLTQYAAMRLNSEFAAFASIASPETTFNASPRVLNDWRPGFRVPMLLINANADPNVLFYKPWLSPPDVIIQNIADWIDVSNRPSDPYYSSYTIDTVTEKPINLKAFKYVYCSGYVQFYIIDGGGHQWHMPNGFVLPPDIPTEGLCQDINTTDIVWDFFKNRRKSDNGYIPNY